MSLHKYIDQLLQDIAHATQNVPASWTSIEEEADEDFGILPWMEDMENAPTKSLEEWTNLKKEQFPPQDRLTDKQVHVLLAAIKKMLDAYNCSAVFQIEVPERIQYKVIRARFQQQVPMLKANYFFFEFCDKRNSTDRSGCLLGEQYCHCIFFEDFFNKFENTEEDTDYGIDPYEEYMLKRRYGDDWRKHLHYEGEFDFDPDQYIDREEDDFGLDDLEDDHDNLPF